MRTVNPEKLEARRREILAAASRCFREKGFHATSIAEICAAADISAGGLYRYFASKEDIIAAMADEERQILADALDSVAASADFFGAIDQLFASFADMMCDSGEASLAAELFAEATRNPTFAAVLRRNQAAVIDDIRAFLKAGQASGQVDPELDANEAASVLMAVTDGLGVRLMIMGGLSAEDAASAMRNFVTRYLKRPAGQADGPAMIETKTASRAQALKSCSMTGQMDPAGDRV